MGPLNFNWKGIFLKLKSVTFQIDLVHPWVRLDIKEFDGKSSDIWASKFHKDFQNMHVDRWMDGWWMIWNRMHWKEFTDTRRVSKQWWDLRSIFRIYEDRRTKRDSASIHATKRFKSMLFRNLFSQGLRMKETAQSIRRHWSNSIALCLHTNLNNSNLPQLMLQFQFR